MTPIDAQLAAIDARAAERLRLLGPISPQASQEAADAHWRSRLVILSDQFLARLRAVHGGARP